MPEPLSPWGRGTTASALAMHGVRPTEAPFPIVERTPGDVEATTSAGQLARAAGNAGARTRRDCGGVLYPPERPATPLLTSGRRPDGTRT